ncbi:MAG: PAS domain S-box protein [Chloroflexi bacterium]|nr:PAS domain S-box protein [Chloroflexota bacterium]
MCEAGVLDSALWLGQLWEQTPDAMALSDASGTVLAANPAYYELYGYAPDEVLGRNFAIIFPAEQRPAAQALYQEVFNSQTRPETPRSTVRNKAGAERVVESRVIFIGVGGERKAMLSIIRDVTDEVSAQRFAERAQTEMRALLFSLSHDVKSPLSVIKGHAQVLRRLMTRRDAAVSPERARETLMQIETNALRVAELVDELVEVATLDEGASLPLRVSQVDLMEVVHETVGRYRRLTDRHTLVIEARDQSVLGTWDERRVMRVIDNLLSNAIKYSPDGGLIRIRVACADRPRFSVAESSEQGLPGVDLCVEDNGIGIAPDDLPHVFDRFRRGRNVPETVVGSGIGLSSVDQIVRQHGGRIDISSNVGRGTTVAVWLPLHQPELDQAPDEP